MKHSNMIKIEDITDEINKMPFENEHILKIQHS